MQITYKELQKSFKIVVIGTIVFLIIGWGISILVRKSKIPAETPPLAIVEVETVNNVNKNLKEKSIEFLNISVVENFEVVKPETDVVNIYSYSSKIISKELIDNLVSILDVPNLQTDLVGTENEVITARGANGILYIYVAKGTIIYADLTENPSPETFSSETNVEQYKSYAQDLIKNLGFDSNIYKFSSYNYITDQGKEIGVTKSPIKANMIEIVYESYFDEYKVIDRDTSLIPNVISVWLDPSGKVKKFNADLSGNIENPTSQVTIKSEDEIRKDIENENVTLIDTFLSEYDQITNVVVQKAELAYYRANDKLVPIYLLTATVASDEGTVDTGHLYLEAIRR